MSTKRATDLFASVDDFERVDHSRWQSTVLGDLKGAPFERLVDGRLVDGIAIEPLYDASNAHAVQGARAIDRGRLEGEPLGVMQAVDVVESDWSEAAREAVEGGATGLYFDLVGARAKNAAKVLEDTARWSSAIGHADVDLLIVDRILPELEAMRALRGACPSARIHHVCDAWATAAIEGTEPLAGESAAHAFATMCRDVSELESPRVRFLVSTHVYRDAGADLALEIAIAAATLAETARALSETAVTPDILARDLLVDTAIGPDIFGELAKVRALRAVSGRVLEGIGATDTHVRVLARSAEHVLSGLDPWVNMLRASDHALSAACAGVWSVCLAPYDARFEGSNAIGTRTARNTILIAKDEAHLGRVVDPAGGSHYIESLTADLAARAWQHLMEIEQVGGLAKALASGELRKRVDAIWQRTKQAIATRKLSIVGAGDYAVDAESTGAELRRNERPEGAWPIRYHAGPFETLRARARAMETRPEAIILTFGSEAEWSARAQFAADFAHAGGFSSRRVAFTDDEPTVSAALRGDGNRAASVVFLVAKDDAYDEFAEAAAAIARKAGARRVVVCGKPGVAGDSSTNIDDHVHLGVNVVDKLEALLGACEREVAS